MVPSTGQSHMPNRTCGRPPGEDVWWEENEYVKSGVPRCTGSDALARILTTVTGKGVPGGRKSCEEEEDIGRLEVGAESTNGKLEWAERDLRGLRYNTAVRSGRGDCCRFRGERERARR